MNEIKGLFKLKSILSLLFSVTTCYLALKGKLNMETFIAITMSIITYYFTRDNKNNE